MQTTKTMLKEYQKNLCVISNNEEPDSARIERKKILTMFIISKDKNEKTIIFILLGIFMSGIERFKINKRK